MSNNYPDFNYYNRKPPERHSQGSFLFNQNPSSSFLPTQMQENIIQQQYPEHSRPVGNQYTSNELGFGSHSSQRKLYPDPPTTSTDSTQMDIDDDDDDFDSIPRTSILSLGTSNLSLQGDLESRNRMSPSYSQRYTSSPPGLVSTLQKEQDLDELKGRCVTVYGFPPNLTNYTLSKFSEFGDIEYYWSGEGNWINICYRRSFDAELALSKNGHKFDNVILGVKRIDEREISERDKENIEHYVVNEKEDKEKWSKEVKKVQFDDEMRPVTMVEEDYVSPYAARGWLDTFLDYFFKF